MQPVNMKTLDEPTINLMRQYDPDHTPASYGLRFPASFEQVKVVLSGMSQMDQVIDNVKTFNSFSKLNDADYELLTHATQMFYSTNSIMCTGCMYCDVCPKKIQIPNIFQLWNIYQKNKNTGILGGRPIDQEFVTRYNVNVKFAGSEKCISCGLCKIKCPQSIDIPKKLQEIRQLYQEKSSQKVSDPPLMVDAIEYGISNKATDLFTLHITPNYVEFYRCKMACLKPPISGENRWIALHLPQRIIAGRSYTLTYSCQTNRTMKRVFFLSNGYATQTLVLSLEADKLVHGCITFKAVIDAENICITATDLPVTADYLRIYKIHIE